MLKHTLTHLCRFLVHSYLFTNDSMIKGSVHWHKGGFELSRVQGTFGLPRCGQSGPERRLRSLFMFLQIEPQRRFRIPKAEDQTAPGAQHTLLAAMLVCFSGVVDTCLHAKASKRRSVPRVTQLNQRSVTA